MLQTTAVTKGILVIKSQPVAAQSRHLLNANRYLLWYYIKPTVKRRKVYKIFKYCTTKVTVKVTSEKLTLHHDDTENQQCDTSDMKNWIRVALMSQVVFRWKPSKAVSACW